MVFSSIEFLYYFLPAAVLLHFAAPKRLKNLTLCASGILFYAWGEPIYVFVMLFSTLIDYTAGRFLEKTDDIKKRKACLITSVTMNLGLLFVFKYSSFAVSIINSALKVNIPDPNLPLPIGISFFTFQSMSYTIDLYRGRIKTQRSFIDFCAYVTMFPQIVAGPIVKYQDVESQLRERKITLDGVNSGVNVFIRGLAKKVLLANNIGLVWEQVKAMDYSSLPALTAWTGIIAFSFQIYFDFSGYSDMAVGLGKMLGFTFLENLNLPYLSKSVSEFWRRWHISLGSWFREYVYFPLGGSHTTTVKTIRNLITVWFLTGLWHGASINFTVWGLWFGMWIIFEHLGLSDVLKKLPPAISWLYTMLTVVIGWVLFEIPALTDAILYLRAMFGMAGGADSTSLLLLAEAAVGLAACAFFASGARRDYIKRLGGSDSKVVTAVTPIINAVLLTACTAYLVNSGYNPFLYFNF